MSILDADHYLSGVSPLIEVRYQIMMMTGQVLSGVSPLIAVRYQIMVMCMIIGAAGLSTVCLLAMIRKTEHFRVIN